MLRHFQRSGPFARDQRLQLETSGMRMSDFHKNPLSQDELERQREKSRGVPLWLVTASISAEDLIADRAGIVDPLVPVLTKVICLVDALKMGGSYELAE